MPRPACGPVTDSEVISPELKITPSKLALPSEAPLKRRMPFDWIGPAASPGPRPATVPWLKTAPLTSSPTCSEMPSPLLPSPASITPDLALTIV